MTSIKIHQAVNKTFIVEGLEKRLEPIPAFALPGHVDSAYQGAEQTLEVILPALRFATSVGRMVELVKYRVGEGDLEPIIYGPGRQPVRSFDGPAVPPCEVMAHMAKLDGGYAVTTYRAVSSDSPPPFDGELETPNARDIAKLWPVGAWAVRSMGAPIMHKAQTHAVATLDEALQVLGAFFGA